MSVISLPDQLYNKKTLFTLSGSSISVWLLTIVINDAFDLHQKHKWIGLIVSLLLSFIGATQIRKLSLSLSTVAFFNGLLIYVTATGIDSINNGVNNTGRSDSVKTSTLIPFLRSDPWWPPEILLEKINSLKKTNVQLVSELAAQKSAFVAQRQILIDSLAKGNVAMEPAPNKKSNPTANECRSYIDEINVLKKRIDDLTKSGGDPNKEAQSILAQIAAENAKVLKALEDYLNIPLERPLDKRKTIPELEEDIFAWRSSLLDYNTRIESILKKLN